MGEFPLWEGASHEIRTEVEVTGLTTGLPGGLGGPVEGEREREEEEEGMSQNSTLI